MVNWPVAIAIIITLGLYGALCYVVGYGHAQIDATIKAIDESLDRIDALKGN